MATSYDKGIVMALVGIAQETLRIVAEGKYEAPSGREVEVGAAVRRAVSGTELLRPESLHAALAARAAVGSSTGITGRTVVEVTAEKTDEAGRRLVREGHGPVLALNFASAKNPGGGFLRGAKAQEEDLARCSALYTCQLEQRAYYDENRACGSMLYTDHMIYSPTVPFFRDARLALLEEPFVLSILTAPAPNAGEHRRIAGASEEALATALDRRAAMVLAFAASRGYRVLVLGAWGCGVFRNEPRAVAEVFARHLASPAFVGAFTRVAFAVYDRSEGRATYAAFRDRFADG